VLDGVESSLSGDLLKREISVRDEESDSLNLNFTDRVVNGVAQHSREPGPAVDRSMRIAAAGNTKDLRYRLVCEIEIVIARPITSKE